MSNEALSLKHSAAPFGATEAVVLNVSDDGRVDVRLAGAQPPTSELRGSARVAMPGYTPAAGDRVLLVPGASAGDLYVVGVLRASAPPVVRTAQGASATLEDDKIVVRDAKNNVAVVFDPATGAATISAPAGDLTLSAPSGRVVLAAGEDVCVRAERDATFTAGRMIEHSVRSEDSHSRIAQDANGVKVAAPTLGVQSRVAQADIDEATVVAERIATRATQVLTSVGRWELKAKRLVERVHDAYRDVEGLAQTRAERVRTIVRDTLQIAARKTHLASKDDTKIDGKRVLLG